MYRGSLDSKAFEVIQSKLNHSVRRANLANFLKYGLKQKGVDRYFTALLSGMDPFENAALYYTQTSPRAAYIHYSSIIHELGLNAPEYTEGDQQLFDEEKDYTIGSMNVPKKEVITKFFKEIRELLEGNRPITELEWLQHHSYMAVYTYLVLNLCTGHRPSISAYSKASYIDVRGKMCFIADKFVTSVKHGRTVPLIDVAINQLDVYKRHLESFVVFLKSPRGCDVLLSKVLRCMDSTDDHYPYLFLFNPIGSDDDHTARKYNSSVPGILIFYTLRIL